MSLGGKLMAASNGVTFKWIAGFLVTLLILALSMGVSHTVGAIKTVDTKITLCEKDKIDKTQYYEDIHWIRDKLKTIEAKVDKIRR